jgi:hypothetical protein
MGLLFKLQSRPLGGSSFFEASVFLDQSSWLD